MDVRAQLTRALVVVTFAGCSFQSLDGYSVPSRAADAGARSIARTPDATMSDAADFDANNFDASNFDANDFDVAGFDVAGFDAPPFDASFDAGDSGLDDAGLSPCDELANCCLSLTGIDGEMCDDIVLNDDDAVCQSSLHTLCAADAGF